MDGSLREESDFGGTLKGENQDMRIFGWQFKGGKGGYEDIWEAV